MFGRKKKKNTDLDPLLEAELEAGVHVMRDDLDELSGKQKPKKPVAAPVETPSHASGSGSPFLSDVPSSSAVSSTPPKQAAPKRDQQADTRQKISESAIVFDDEQDKVSAGKESETSEQKPSEMRKKGAPRQSAGKAKEWGMPERKASGMSAAPEKKQVPAEGRPPKKEEPDMPLAESKPRSSDQAPAALPVSPFLDVQTGNAPKKDAPDTTSEPDSGDLESVLASLGSHEQTAPPPRSAPDSGSPGDGRSSRRTISETTPQAPKAPEAPKVRDIPPSPTSRNVSARGSRRMLPVAALLLIMIIVGAAGYLYLMPDSESTVLETTPEPSEPETPDESESSEPVEPQPDPFSQEMPNILILDTESADMTSGGIKRLLTDTETEVRSMNPSSPVEFVIRDANNNPVAFSRLAFLLELSIPSDVLASFDESFSIYFVVDGDEAYRALSVDIRDEEATTLLRAEEADMPEWFRGLLYDDAATFPTAPKFSDGSYGTLETRFVNFGTGDLSLDYAALDSSLIIGTSKDSFRAALGSVIRIR